VTCVLSNDKFPSGRYPEGNYDVLESKYSCAWLLLSCDGVLIRAIQKPHDAIGFGRLARTKTVPNLDAAIEPGVNRRVGGTGSPYSKASIT
jgi:hypothetical protein